jgi:hypothetical protein
VLHQDTAHGKRDAVSIVGLDPRLPQYARNHTEHGTAIEALQAALQRVAAEPANLK